MSTITLETGRQTDDERCESPEGLEKVSQGSYEIRGKTYTDYTYRFPELGPARLFDHIQGGVVIPISGQRYRMIVEIEDGYSSIPVGATVTLIPTDEPETEFTPYDQRKLNEAKVPELEARIAEYEDMLKGGDDSWLTSQITKWQGEIADILNGENVYSHNTYAQVFGQPVFIQGIMTPSFEGRSAFHLLTLETGWGDSGNLNIMVGLDSEGVPCRVWFEASCC